VNVSEIREALDQAFDQAVVFHGFADYMRDYDVFVYATADPQAGIAPGHLRYRFKHCVRARVITALRPEIWKRSLDERFLDLVEYEQASDLAGFVWGVKWQELYPGMKLLPKSIEAQRWADALGLPFHEATIETNAHNISLIFSDLAVDVVGPGHAPFVVAGGGPDFKFPVS
jgi:hypothetical protein